MRRAIFAAAVVLLIAASIAFGLGGRDETAARPPRSGPVLTAAPGRHSSPGADPDPRPAVRSFLAAFLAYEVRASARSARARIRADATVGFARRLLAGPSGVEAPRHPAPARVTTLHLERLPQRPRLLLATGTAARHGGPEPFAFLFVLRRGRWLALGPAE